MKQIITTLAIIIAAASITSCKKTTTTTPTPTPKSIVGFWKGTHVTNGTNYPRAYLFNSNGSMTFYDNQDTAAGGYRWKGLYTVTDGTILMKYSVQENGNTFEQEETATLTSSYTSFTGTFKFITIPNNGTTSATKQ
jgi:hypothetical protein